MNQTLLNIIQSRHDISDYLFHFATGNSAKETLRKIIEDKAIIDIKGRNCICFTEAPLLLMTEMFEIFNKYYDPMYAPYGIGIKKDVLFNDGARPVIYGTISEGNLLPETLRWRFEEYIPHVKDYSWLREWRIKKDSVPLNGDNCFVITKEKFEMEEDLHSLVDVKFDGCVSDGEYHGDAIGIFSRDLKSVSFEDIKELNSLSKSDLDELLRRQGIDEVTKQGLGGFII